jgi:hypothetical protein
MNRKYLHSVTLYAFLLPTLAFSQSHNALSRYLGQKQLSATPSSFQTQVAPGGLIVLNRHTHGTKYYPPRTEIHVQASAVKVDMPAVKADDSIYADLALTILGFTPDANFHNASTLDVAALTLTGIALGQDDIDGILAAAGGQTFSLAQQNWTHGNDIYLIEAVYSTENVSVATTQTDGVKLSSGQPIDACPATGTILAHTAGQTPTIPAGGAVQICRQKDSSVQLKSDHPVAIALKVQRLSFSQHYAALNATPEAYQFE